MTSDQIGAWFGLFITACVIFGAICFYLGDP